MKRRILKTLLTPGLYLKRWIFLSALGAFMFFWGLHRIKGEMDKYHLKLNLQLMMIFFGAALILFGIYKIFSWGLKYAGFTRHAFFSRLVDSNLLSRGPKIVLLGGGTGLATLLAGIKDQTSNITACVTVTDEGGSSGRLRDAFGIAAPGDIRNCIVALSSAPTLVSDLFNYRFQEGEGLKGHSLGNLFIAALTRITGSFERAVEESCRVLATRGRVLPITRESVHLCAQLSDGREVRGETMIGNSPLPISRLWFEPAQFEVNPDALDAILEADLVVVGPGSLYTSILPTVLPQLCQRALLETDAPVLYVCNIMTEPGETAAYSAADHVRAIYGHLGDSARNLFDWIIVNTEPPPRDYIEKYRQEGSEPVRADADALRQLGLRILAGDFLKGDVPVMTAEGEKHVLRHDPAKLVQKLMPLARMSAHA